MSKRHELGKKGEIVACEFLLKNYYEIIERNFKSKLGEIDIIAREGDEIVFVEVKTRGQDKYGMPAEAVDKRKKNHIYHVAEYYLMINELEDAFCRIDVIEVFFFNNKFKINHLRNCVDDKPKKKHYEYIDEFYDDYDEYVE